MASVCLIDKFTRAQGVVFFFFFFFFALVCSTLLVATPLVTSPHVVPIDKRVRVFCIWFAGRSIGQLRCLFRIQPLSTNVLEANFRVSHLHSTTSSLDIDQLSF